MTTSHEYDLVCIGSCPAGQRGAVQAAKLGKKVAVIEKRRCLGGVCIDTGTIPSKTFREAVLALATPNVFENGQLRRHRPTAEQLLRRVGEVVQRESDVIEDQLTRNDIDLYRGHATFADPHAITVEADDVKQTLRSKFFLIAVGTRPTPPRGVDPGNDLVLTSDGICGLKKLPRSLTVVGAGVIGIEYASMFAMLGVQVTLVDQRSRPLEFVDHEIVDELIHQMRSRNVLFRLGEAVAKVTVKETNGRKAVIELESGKHLVSDMVLFSVGRVGATAELNLGAAGLSADDRGRLKVNDHFRTEVEHIFAAGDIIGYPSLAATSSEQGRRAACAAFDHQWRPMEPHFPIGIYAIPEISMVGAPEFELTEKKIPYEVGIARYREIARGQILGDDSGLFKMLFHRETRKLLGVHAIGTGATELIHIGQAVIGLGAGLDYFVHTVFNYPTLAECYKVAALDALNKLSL